MELNGNLLPELGEILAIQDHLERWRRILCFRSRNADAFRTLLLIEVVAVIDKWEEPTPADRFRLLDHVVQGGRFQVQVGRVFDLLQAVWPLELAKHDVALVKLLDRKEISSRFFFTWLKARCTATVQVWWAFETLMNDFASIILAQRSSTMTEIQALLLKDEVVQLDKKGQVERRSAYQPVESRVQFIHETLTGRPIDRDSPEWHSIVALKRARDWQVHKVGKPKEDDRPSSATETITKGLRAVQTVIQGVLRHTPEFKERFAYLFLSFWSCEVDVPFVWDGRDGGLSIDLLGLSLEQAIAYHAPAESSLQTSSRG